MDRANPVFAALTGAYDLPAERVTTPEAREEAVRSAYERGALSSIELRLPEANR